MSNTILTPGKVPFDHGLFFSAVQHLLGEPDRKLNYGDSGYYDWSWEVGTKERLRNVLGKIENIQRWMKLFDLLFPESRCDIAKWSELPNPEKEYFRITVRFSVTEKEQ